MPDIYSRLAYHDDEHNERTCHRDYIAHLFYWCLVMQPAMAGLILLPGNIVNVLFSPLIGALYNRYAMRPLLSLVLCASHWVQRYSL